MDVSCVRFVAAFASLTFILFLSWGEKTGGGVPDGAIKAHQEGYGAEKPQGDEKVDSAEKPQGDCDGSAASLVLAVGSPARETAG